MSYLKSTFLEKDLRSALNNAQLPNPTTTTNSPVIVSKTENTVLDKGVKNSSAVEKGEKNESNKNNKSRTDEVNIYKNVSSADKALFYSIIDKKDLFKPSRQYTTDVWFRFFAHYIKDGKYYFKFQIENESDLDYKIDKLFFSVETLKKRNSSDTRKEINFTKFLNPTEVVPAKSKIYLVFEFDSFSMNKTEEFKVETKEKDGARNFVVGIPYFIINKPIKL